MLIAKGAFAEAETMLSQAIRLNPKDYVAHNNLGVIDQLRGKRKEAAAHYRAALAIQPDYQNAKVNLAKLGP